MLIEILGAGALLLWGLRLVRTGVGRAIGARLRHWLAIGTGNRVLSFLAGFGATCAMQSSTATALMTASFASREMIAPAMALAIMLGADVGTSVVARVLVFDLGWLSPLLVLCGVALFMTNSASRPRAIGRAILGLGLLLLALSLLAQTSGPLRTSPVAHTLFAALEGAPVLGAALAALMTIATSSSLAVVLFIVSLAASGTVAPPLAVALVLGANIGGGVVPVIATFGAGPTARRVPVGNLAMRVAGGMALMPFVGGIAVWLLAISDSAGFLVVNMHLAFNLGLAVIFLPLVSSLARSLERLLPEGPNEPGGPRYLDPAGLESPGVALSLSIRETIHMGEIVQAMLSQCALALRENDLTHCRDIQAQEDEVDLLLYEVKAYLSRLGRDGDLDEEDTRRSTEIMSFAINLEHAGDVIDNNLRDLIEKMIRNRLVFSTEGEREISELCDRVLDNLRIALGVFISRDERLSRRLLETKVGVRNLEKSSADAHLKRLREGRPESLETSALHLDILRDLKRINSHVTSVAYPILEDAGLLEDSRLLSEKASEKRQTL